MNHSQFLKILQKQHSVHNSLLPFIPKTERGTDLKNLPEWITKAYGTNDIRTAAQKMLAHDWTKSYVSIVKKIMRNNPKGYPEDLLIGQIHSHELNGTIFRIPSELGDGILCVIPFGTFMIPSNVGGIINSLFDNKFKAKIINGWLEVSGIKKLPLSNFIRRLRSNLYDSILKDKHTPQWLAVQFCILLRKYRNNGLAEPPDIVKEFPIVPLYDSPYRLGHPSEFGRSINDLILIFLILHEISHLHLGHLDSERQATISDEFEADSGALNLIFQSEINDSSKIAIVLAFVIFLYVDHFLSTIIMNSNNTETKTHPEGLERVEKIKSFLITNPNSKDIIKAINEIDVVMKSLWNRSIKFREGPIFNIENEIEVLLYQDISIFQDQTIRLLSFGSNEKIIHQIAQLRAKYENHQSENSDYLSKIMWIFDTAKVCEEQYLYNSLMKTYLNIIKDENKDQ